MYIVYVIQSKEGYKYTGQTNNMQRRISEHNANSTKWTKIGKDWTLIYSEECSSRREAIKREKYLKSGVGREFINMGVFNKTDLL